MTEETALSLLLEEPEIHAKYLERHRAEYLTKTVWALMHDHISWRNVPTTPVGKFGEEGVGGTKGGTPEYESGFELVPRFIEYKVPAVAILVFEEEVRRIWYTRLRDGVRSLTEDERFAWREHTLRPRYSSVFHIVHRHAMVRRADSVRASKEIASAALKLNTFSELQRVEPSE